MASDGSGKAGTGRGRDLDASDFEGDAGMSIELDTAPMSGPHPSQRGQPAAPSSQPHPSQPQGYGSGHQQAMPGQLMPGPPSSGMIPQPPHSAPHSAPSGMIPQPPNSQPQGSMPQLPVQAPAQPAPPPKPRRLKRHELAPEVRAAMDFAEYGDPPEAIWQTPMYAARVLWRKHEIRNELLQARVANNQGRVKLFEDSLLVDDKPSVKMGIILWGVAFALLVILAATPVAIRFIKLALYG